MMLIGTIVPVIALNILPTLLITWAVLQFAGHYKVGKPQGYAELKLNLYLIKLGLKKSPYITTSQKWGVGRYD